MRLLSPDRPPRARLAALACGAALAACGGAPDAPTGAGPAARGVPDAAGAGASAGAHWLTGADATAGEPAACVDSAGRLWATWLAWSDSGPTLAVACLARDGDGWRELAAARLAETDRGLGFARLAPLGEGVYVAHETRADDEHRIVGRALSLVGAEVTRGPLESIAAGGLAPTLASTPDGALVAAWQEAVGDGYDVRWRRRGADGSWSATVASTATPWDEWSPRVAAGPEGSVWLAWDAWVDGSFDVFCRGPLGAPAEATWRLGAGPGFEAYPDVAVDGDGRPWIAYERAPDFGVAGALRERRGVRLVRLEPDGSTRAASLPVELEADGQFPRVAIGAAGLLLTVRRADAPWKPRSGGASQNAVGIHHSWSSWAARWRNGACAVDAVPRSVGDNEASESLVLAGGDAFAVLAADDRRRGFGAITEWHQPLEGRWRVGVVALGPPGALPPLEAAEPPLALPDVGAFAPPARGPWLFGDLHRHTHLSRCAGPSDGTRVDNYRYARGPGALDFVSLNDHFQHLTLWSWWRSLRDVERFHDAPRLVVLPGIERNVNGEGHQNLVYVDEVSARADEHGWRMDGGPPTSIAPPAVVGIPHMMSSTNNRFLPERLDPELQPVMELYQGTRGSYEGPFAPFGAKDARPAGPHAADFLALGTALGWIASSDHGESGDGFCVLDGAERTRAGVLAALFERRTAAATSRSAARLSVGDVRGGASGPIDRGAPVRVELGPSPAPVATVELLVNGEVAARRDGGDGVHEELLVVSSQFRPAREDRPIVVSVGGGRIVDARLRRGERPGVGFRVDADGTAELWTDRQRADLVLRVAWTEGPRRMTIRFNDALERVALRHLPPGRAYRLAQLDGLETLWRIGRPVEDRAAAFVFDDVALGAGDAVYARIAYADGNALWTSPARVTSVRE